MSPEIVVSRRDLLRRIRRLSIEEQRQLVRTAAAGELTDDERRLFLENAQISLGGVDDTRIGFLVRYACWLQDTLLEGSLPRPELALVLVSIAYDLLYGGDNAEVD